MTRNQSGHVSELIASANAIADEVSARFGAFSTQQLNWKPSPDQWSVAQCLDHLITANVLYFPVFEKVLRGEKKNTFWERLPWFPAFWGRMLIKSVSPESTRKLTAPPIFRPSSSNVDGDIVRRFMDHQKRIVESMKATGNLDLEAIIISSPVSPVVTYSLMDAYKIIVTHEKRHLLQATRVSRADGFPNSR